MWNCPLCKEKNRENIKKCKCGYDKSLDYGKYPTISILSANEKQKYEQSIIEQSVVEKKESNLIENTWMEWTKSVQKEIGALDPKIGIQIISKMREYYNSMILDARLESEKMKRKINKPVPVKVYGNTLGNNNDLEFHKKMVTYKGSLITTWTIGEDEEIIKNTNTREFKSFTEEKERQNHEGNCWYFGKNRTKNYKKAVECYKKAIERGNVDALNNLGNCYYFGNGVEKNDELAIEYYRKAAEKMHPAASFNLAYCYLVGIGTRMNRELANTLYERAAMYASIELKNKVKMV